MDGQNDASRRLTARSGFTLVEILVTCAIISLLCLLILPAVQRAREASRKIQCLNNLRNLGVALNQHASTSGAYPAGYGSPLGDSYLVKLLPYIDQKALYDAFNLELPPGRQILSNENGTALFKPVNLLMCPSDAHRTDPLATYSANYAANAGHHAISGSGAFIGRSLSPDEITDGLSGTVALSEWVVGAGNGARKTRLGTTYRLPNNIGDFAQFHKSCGMLDPRIAMPGDPGYKGQFWISGGFGTTQYNHLLVPNTPSCFNVYFTGFSAGSYHGAGCNALRMDGRASFVKESIDTRVWSSLGTRSGGEVVADE